MSSPVTPELVDDADLVLHMSRSDSLLNSAAHRLHARPAFLLGGELGLDGMQLDHFRALHVLVGIVGADHIGAVLLVHAL